MVKCMDYVNGGRLTLGRHNSGCGPQPPGRRQIHSRRAHSFLCIFEKLSTRRASRSGRLVNVPAEPVRQSDTETTVSDGAPIVPTTADHDAGYGAETAPSA